MTPSTILEKLSRSRAARLLVVAALFAACAVSTAAQSVAPSADKGERDKTVEARRLFKAVGVSGHSAGIFEELVGRYQKNWPDAVIAGFKEKGLFKPLTPAQAEQMEKLVHEFSDRTFGSIKSRVAAELFEERPLEEFVAPVFGKYLEADEMARAADFAESPLGKKFLGFCHLKMRDSIVAAMESKGIFNVSPSPEEETKRADRMLNEVNGGGFALDVRENFAALASTLPDNFTPEELRQLSAFAQSPLGRKLAGLYEPLTRELLQRSAVVNAPRVGRITEEVFAEQMKFFGGRVDEIMKGSAPADDSPRDFTTTVPPKRKKP